MELAELFNTLASRYTTKHGISPVTFALHTPDGEEISVGEGFPVFAIRFHNQDGVRAIKSLNKLQTAEAYIKGNYDIEGDFIQAVSFQSTLFSDRNIWLKIWRHLKPLLLGRRRCWLLWQGGRCSERPKVVLI